MLEDPLPPPSWGGGAPVRALGRREEKKNPLSQKSKIFASSPKGRAKAAFGGRLPDKLQFGVFTKNEGDFRLPHQVFHQNRGTTAPA